MTLALVAAAALLALATAPGRAGTRATSPPTIESFTPTKGAVWRSVTITGTNFRGTSVVKFGSVATMFTVVSGTTIKVNVPPGAVTAPISVTNNKGKAVSADPFIVLPKITSFSPAMGGPVGALVTITGTTFNGTTAVSFGSVAADLSTAVLKNSKIKVTVPAGAVTAKIYVTTPSGTAHSATAFKVTH